MQGAMHVLRSPLLPHPWSRAPRTPAAAAAPVSPRSPAAIATPVPLARVASAGHCCYAHPRPARARCVRRLLMPSPRPPPSGSRAPRPPTAAAVAVPLARAAYLGRRCIARPTGTRRVLRPLLPRPSLSRTPANAAAPVPLARATSAKTSTSAGRCCRVR